MYLIKFATIKQKQAQVCEVQNALKQNDLTQKYTTQKGS